MNAPHDTKVGPDDWRPPVMKRRLMCVALTFAALFVAGQGGPCLASPEEVFRKRAEERFKANDVDMDGYLEGEEIPGDIRNIMAEAKVSPDIRLNFEQFLRYRELAYKVQVAAFFKERDRNGDGFLQKHEMPLLLMKNLAKYSRVGDRVNFQEFLQFSRERDFPDPQPQPAPKDKDKPKDKGADPAHEVVEVDQTDFESRPTVYRAGKLPRGLPEWFERLDEDMDGQVSLYEWRKSGKPLEDFAAWDLNDDGLITVEEILLKLKRDRLAPRKSDKAKTPRPTIAEAP